MKLLIATALLTFSLSAAEKTVTWTGWFADLKCHAPGPVSGKVRPTNPDCAKTCIEKGAPATFLSEQANAAFQVKGYSVLDDLGYHVEVQATVDDAAKTIAIQQVKRLEYQGPACARPRKH